MSTPSVVPSMREIHELEFFGGPLDGQRKEVPCLVENGVPYLSFYNGKELGSFAYYSLQDGKMRYSKLSAVALMRAIFGPDREHED